MYQTEVKFHKFPIFDLLVKDAQGLSIFGSDYNAAGIAVNAVAQSGNEAVFLFRIVLPFLIDAFYQEIV